MAAQNEQVLEAMYFETVGLDTGRAASATVPEVGWLVVWDHGKLVARRAARAAP